MAGKNKQYVFTNVDVLALISVAFPQSTKVALRGAKHTSHSSMFISCSTLLNRLIVFIICDEIYFDSYCDVITSYCSKDLQNE